MVISGHFANLCHPSWHFASSARSLPPLDIGIVFVWEVLVICWQLLAVNYVAHGLQCMGCTAIGERRKYTAK